MARKARISRKTKETDITVELNLDGRGKHDVLTPIPFFSHMLSALAKHALFDLKMSAKGDVDVDLHHTVEDAGICLGEAFKKAIGDKTGIRRLGNASVPMMDSMSTAVLDISGRPYFRFNSGKDGSSVTKRIFPAVKTAAVFDFGLVKEFMIAFSNNAGIDLHLTLNYGEDIHHSIESAFKALGRALKDASQKDARIKGVLSTKGKL
ncbi:MAG: imidazoleglycerol-phosphate dehydratase HisB [Deltaproteobacteria bacterium]|nr:imidazoleglycerol-phosphate dehydratase HisB [Deltaproteobacteria bacterium]